MKTAFDPARIRALREQRAWSQEQLAEVAGISVRTIQRAETSGNASAETRMALAAALDVPLQAFAPVVPAQEQATVAPTAELARHARSLVVVG